MLFRYLFLFVALLLLPSIACATHIHYESYAEFNSDGVVASFGSDADTWQAGFSLTGDLMPLWDIGVDHPSLETVFDPSDSYGNGSYDPAGALHYVYLRIDPNNYPPEGSPTSTYIALRVNDTSVDSWSDPILLYSWGVPDEDIYDPFGIRTNGYQINVELIGLAALSDLKNYSPSNGNNLVGENKLPLQITNVNLEGCFETASPVPEPSTLMLLGAGLVVAAVWRRKQRH